MLTDTLLPLISVISRTLLKGFTASALLPDTVMCNMSPTLIVKSPAWLETEASDSAGIWSMFCM